MSSDLTSFYSHRNINAINSNDNEVYEFERFRLETANRMLFENEQPVQLAPKVIETLIALVRARGEIISKENLMNEVWADSFVEEANLTQHIYLLRKTLGKAADGRDLIETFRRRGYRFTGELKQPRQTTAQFKENEFSNIGGDSKRNFVAEKDTPIAEKRKKYLIAAAVFAGLLITAAFAVPRFFSSKTPTAQNQLIVNSPPIKSTRLTPDINAYAASFTPDGKHLVYTLQEKDRESVWLKDLTTGAATQIQPPSDKGYQNPTISRDNFLYFMNRQKDMPNNTLVRVSLAGGEQQIIATDLTSPFTLSPDEEKLAFINSKWQIIIAAADAKSEPRILAQRDVKKNWYETWSSRLSWSPDGASLAVCGGRKTESGKLIRELIEVGAADGSEKIIPTPENWKYIDDAVWLGDKSGLLVTVRESVTAPFQIWRVAYPNGETVRVTNDTNDYSDLNISPDSRRLVVINNIGNLNLWLAPLNEISKARQITFGSAAQNGFWGMTFAPDGKIIYTSPRSGNFDLWQTSADGGNQQKQLTQKSGEWNGKPQATADGRYIIFSSTRSGAMQIWRMDADGGNAKQITNEDFADEATLSGIGDAIYFTVRNDDKSQIFKTPIDGGETVRITKPPIDFFLPSISPDGKLIFCRTYDSSSNSPWKSGLLNAETGELLKTFDLIYTAARWTADSKSVIYSSDDANLRRISIEENAKPQPITNFDGGKIPSFAVSPDSKQIAFSRGEWTSEAVLLENF